MTAQSSHGQTVTSAHTQQCPQLAKVRPALSRLPLLVALVFVFMLLGASTALGITRATVLARAQTWVDNPVPYSQLKYFGGYRTDCSGYVSMCWKTGTSWSTSTFHSVGRRIAVETLQPGDAMLAAGYHIRLFYGWVDAAHTQYVAYEQTGPSTKSSIKSMAADLARGYIPFRYNGITDSPTGDALSNGSFDVWASSQPVWWQASAPGTDTPVERRKDVHRTGRNSLELANPTSSARSFAQLAQTADVSPDTTYTLSAWAMTSGAPQGLEMHLRYLDAAGAPVAADIRTTGDLWHVPATGFGRMALTSRTPATAAKAEVTMKLAGGVDASGTAGVSAVFDDISLTRPQATVTFGSSASTTYIGRTVTLAGSITPTSAIGTNMVVWVMKPGTSRWSYSSNRTVYAVDAGAAWVYKYYFKPGMAKGVYSFRAEVPALPGYLGATSQVVAVRLR
jgi:hypothetical protein